MDSEKWKKIKAILEKALELSTAAARSQYLTKACDGDEDLRREVESLLEFDDVQADLLEDSAFESVFDANKNGDSVIGTQIDKYKIIGALGAGGMGAVYLAERADGAFKQKVALKLIKRGMDSDAVLQRFYNERQILASLEHPNIAHLVDGGTTSDGLPFFVMEYVEGETIIEYAKRENLAFEEKLNLFREVCAAVSFAHQNLVVHRDLKPSNILVTKDGKAKLLDFGIAKLFKSETAAETVTQIQIFTPEYASPEQVRGEKLTTATDIYSLGAILYELLTGARPYKSAGKNISEIIRAVCETEPVRPSSVISRPTAIESNETSENQRRKTNGKAQPTNSQFFLRRPKLLKGDLDNIILKSLRKEPARRYTSVEQFSEDLRRHQVGLPVTASADTWNYRARKFIKRNRIGVAAAGLIFVTLLAGLSATIYQAQIAHRERAKAERRFNDVRRLANSFMFEINEEIEKSPLKARELLVTRALEYLDNLAQESENDTDLQSELAAAYEKIGNIQSEIFNPGAGKTSDALVSQQKSLQIREKLFQAEPLNINRGLDAAKSLSNVGDILSMTGRVAEAAESYRQGIRLNENLLALDEKNIHVRQGLARNYARLGQAVLRSGSLSQALENYHRALDIFSRLSAESPNDVSLARSLSIIFSYIGYVKMEMGAASEAVDFFGRALSLMEKNLSADGDNRQARGDVGTAHLWLGIALSELGRADESLAQIRRALEIQTAIYNADTGNFGEQNALADCYLELGRALAAKAKTDGERRLPAAGTGFNEAIAAYETAIKNYEAVWQIDRQNFSAQRQIAFARRYLADAWRHKGETVKALQIFRETLKDFEDLTQIDANNTEWRHDLAICHLRIGEILADGGETAQSALHFEKALSLLEKLSAASPEHIQIKHDLEAVEKHLRSLQT
ncbi:MAG: protein kinase [Pyrinomonadaceae bacterium]|nr:protein kinase [Pyrinomonadaceae bacterium]